MSPINDGELTAYEREQHERHLAARPDQAKVEAEFGAQLAALGVEAAPPTEAVKPFEFTRREGEPLTIETAVFEALGAASTCWTEQRVLVHEGKYGDPDTYRTDWLFNDTRAREIGQALLREIEQVTR